MGDLAENNSRHPSRASLRHATFIDPQSGARMKRSITLHNFDGGNDHDNDIPEANTTTLLGRGGGQSESHKAPIITKVSTRILSIAGNVQQFVRSDTGKGVFKCALAYLIGSLATFVPALSTLLGRNDSKHLVATITVYFHPARSLGSMIDALLLAIGAFIYTAVVSVLSMTVSAFFADTVHRIEVGHAIVLIVFVGGGLGFIGWYKQRKGDPLVNIACSLASLALITILTKEGAVQAGDFSFEKIAQILKMIVAGVIATTAVSFLIFPISARKRLKQNLIDVTDALSDMLALITSSFLSGDEAELEDQTLLSVNQRHHKIFSSIPQNLKEAKYEHYFLGTEKQAWAESTLAECVQQISQSIGGLRSAAAMQFVVIKQPPVTLPKTSSRRPSTFASIATTPSYFTAPTERTFSADSRQIRPQQPQGAAEEPHSNPPYRTASEIFDLFIDHLGPSMRSLAYTLKEILDDLQFDPSQTYSYKVNPKFRLSLDRALDLYKGAREEALKLVYVKKDMDRNRPVEVEADWEEAAACCGHFSFSLLEVAGQVRNYLNILDEMQVEYEEQPSSRSWSWLRFWQLSRRSRNGVDDPGEFVSPVLDPNHTQLQLQIQEPLNNSLEESGTFKERKERLKRKVFLKIYNASAFYRRDDIKFAIKVGFGAVLYAMFSFIPVTRPFYSHWRGEWGLLSYMLVCSMTIGASNTTGYSRVLGTCLGALLAIIAWDVAHPNAVILAFLGFCMAYWTAYIILGQGKGPMGRFIMLTYNLSALYAYSLTVQDDEHDGDEKDSSDRPLILQIAGHRVAAVLSGCLWGLIITRLVWPMSARQKLKDGLSLTWLRMGLIWKRDPLSTLTEGEHSNQYMNLREELELQRFVTKLQGLADASIGEFELRGPFPRQAYGQILKSTSQMLDAFHAMNIVMLKDLHASPGEEVLLQATLSERSQLCSRISHLFNVLASSMKLEYPIANDAVPNIEHTRDRLLARIFAYRKSDAEQQITGDEDYSLLYTYALVTGQLALEINSVLKEVENLFGTFDEEALRLQ